MAEWHPLNWWHWASIRSLRQWVVPQERSVPFFLFPYLTLARASYSFSYSSSLLFALSYHNIPILNKAEGTRRRIGFCLVHPQARSLIITHRNISNPNPQSSNTRMPWFGSATMRFWQVGQERRHPEVDKFTPRGATRFSQIKRNTVL